MRVYTAADVRAKLVTLFPFLAWIALMVSIVLVTAEITSGDLGRWWTVVLVVLIAAAAWCQFLGATPMVNAAGLAMQTLVAVGLLVRWRVG